MRSFDGAPVRFALAGAANTALTYVVYLVLLEVASYRLAYTIAYAFGILSAYVLNARYVFRRGASWRSFLRFPVVHLVQYVLGLVVVTAAVQWLEVPAWAAPILAIVLVVPLTYVLSRAIFVNGDAS